MQKPDSDVTEKRERAEAEKRSPIEEVESAAKLAQLMGLVAPLLSNMPATSGAEGIERFGGGDYVLVLMDRRSRHALPSWICRTIR